MRARVCAPKLNEIPMVIIWKCVLATMGSLRTKRTRTLTDATKFHIPHPPPTSRSRFQPRACVPECLSEYDQQNVAHKVGRLALRALRLRPSSPQRTRVDSWRHSNEMTPNWSERVL